MCFKLFKFLFQILISQAQLAEEDVEEEEFRQQLSQWRKSDVSLKNICLISVCQYVCL